MCVPESIVTLTKCMLFRAGVVNEERVEVKVRFEQLAGDFDNHRIGVGCTE